MSNNIDLQIVVGIKLSREIETRATAKLQFQTLLGSLQDYLKEFAPVLMSAYVSKPIEKIEKTAWTGWTGWTGLAVIEVRSGSVNDVLQKDRPSYVEYWEPNSVLTLCAFDDTEYMKPTGQWGLKRIGALVNWNTLVNTPVTVGVIDSGVMWRWDVVQGIVVGTHEDLDNRVAGAVFPPCLWRSNENPPMDNVDGDGNDYVDDLNGARMIGQPPPGNAGDGVIGDEHGHGTTLAGIMFATPGNAKGIASPVTAYWPNIKLMPTKFFDANRPPTPANARQAIEYAVDNGAKVITTSWHTGPGHNGLTPLEQAIAYAQSMGALVVAAAGNDGRDNDVYSTYPANFSLQYDNVLSVHATDESDRKPSFSNYGKTSVHLGAPGKNIETTVRGGAYYKVSGTSASAAFASIAAALVIAIETHRGNNLSPVQVIAHLCNTADLFSQLSICSQSGGRLNLERAVSTPA